MTSSSTGVDAIILAGGLGTRLKGFVPDIPKCLLPVNGKPFLDIIVHRLSRFKIIRKVVLAVGYMADKIMEHYKNSQAFGFHIVFSVETDLLGTGGAIKKALGYTETDDVLVLNGDSYVEINLEDLISFHSARKAVMTMVVMNVPDTGRYGRVRMDNDGRVLSFEEKFADSTGGYINTGVYLFKKIIFEKVEEEKVISMEKELLPSFLTEPVYGFIAEGKFIDIGIPEAYRISGDYLKD